ncbi:hypothetical protein GXB85_08505 [Cellulomonas sp. APG4]|uniref:hypothetical protein n=1 Tax=Cellulomonas sp. APG4 TaxID=1538656 RepID=UPI00137A1628|nr:hypothetical protein [Cellulomonas sp. APG4]NCT90985.1 hypothetical protein [Cellulomonas sp. APG4]
MTSPTRRLVGAALAIATLLGATGCTASDTDAETATGAGEQVTAPSGDVVATLTEGTEQDGVAMLDVVVTDADGTELFRTPEPYSSRHGVLLAWQSDDDVLWVLSSDVGTSRIDDNGDGWTQTWLTPETRDTMPEEIAALR